MRIFITIILFTNAFITIAQNTKRLIKKGNEFYLQQQYEQAASEYLKALQKDSTDAIANYNIGNAFYKNNKTTETIEAFNKSIRESKDSMVKQKAYYNKGVVLQNQKKLNECVEAYKNALRLNSNDSAARQNLQQALRELKKQEPPKPKPDDKKQNQNKQQQKQQESPPPPPKMDRKKAEQQLQSLRDQEKMLQEKLSKQKAQPGAGNNKDW